MSFISDLRVWENAQKEFAKILLDTRESKVVSLEFAQGKFKDWDIKVNYIPEGEVTYEVKTDTMAQDTGNFVVEYRFKWHPSWIYTSKADYIVYNVLWKWWIQERWELILRLINTEKRETKGWDWRNSSLRVISCEKLPLLFNLFYDGETRPSDSDDTAELPEGSE